MKCIACDSQDAKERICLFEMKINNEEVECVCCDYCAGKCGEDAYKSPVVLGA